MNSLNQQFFKKSKGATLKIAPSLLAFDFGRIADEAKRIEDAGADYIHLDVMDGHFVPNLTMGPQIIAAVNRATDLFLDVHYMGYGPSEYIERFVEAGADGITFHIEATEDVEETLSYIKRCNGTVRAGLAFNPETPFVPRYLQYADLILLMTVHPGFGGQKFISEVLEKVAFVRESCAKLSIRVPRETDNQAAKQVQRSVDIQMDGGIDFDNIRSCVAAGATEVVIGSTLAQAPDLQLAISQMREKANASNFA